MTQLIGLAIFFALLVVVVVVLKRLGVVLGGLLPAESLPYRKKDHLLSKGEHAFYQVLRATVGDEWTTFAKVRLLDLLWLPRGTTKIQSHRNRVQSKHVDFVFCDPRTLSPILVVELDDASHTRSDRQRRDAFVDAALRSAGLPVLHIAARSAYATSDLARQIREAMGAAVPSSVPEYPHVDPP